MGLTTISDEVGSGNLKRDLKQVVREAQYIQSEVMIQKVTW